MGVSSPGPDGKHWLILVWIAGDNNLGSFGTNDIDEMKQVGSNDRVDIVVQYDHAGTGGTRRFHLQHGTTLESDLVADLGETNTGDPAVAIDFFTWGINTYPAQHVMCVLWNHGSGIDETDIYARVRNRPSDPIVPSSNRSATGAAKHAAKPAAKPGMKAATGADVSRGQARAIAASGLRRALFSTTIDAALESKAIAFDDTSCDFLDNAELALVTAAVVRNTGRTIDILGFDACMMNMVEVAYQMRGLVSYLVGSEEVEPSQGWPYHKVAAAAAGTASASPASLATSIVASYVASYADDFEEELVTQSALDIARIEPLVQAVDVLASTCIANLQSAEDYVSFSKAVNSAQRFHLRDFVDLGDLCRQLIAGTAHAEVIAAANSVLALMTGTGGLVVSSKFQGDGVSRSTGTAIYFPIAGDVTVVYDQLDFAQHTRWSELIAKYRTA